jgi:ribosomal protein S19
MYIYTCINTTVYETHVLMHISVHQGGTHMHIYACVDASVYETVCTHHHAYISTPRYTSLHISVHQGGVPACTYTHVLTQQYMKLMCSCIF